MKATKKIFHLFIFCIITFLQLHSCGSPNKPSTPQPSVQDTTSHDYKFEITYLGDGQSYLKDVYAISDSDVWVVGHIFVNDSTGKLDDVNPYNAAHWNGQNWELIHVPTIAYGGYISKGPISCVFAFGSNDVWMFSDAGSYARWDGKKWKSEI